MLGIRSGLKIAPLPLKFFLFISAHQEVCELGPWFLENEFEIEVTQIERKFWSRLQSCTGGEAAKADGEGLQGR